MAAQAAYHVRYGLLTSKTQKGDGHRGGQQKAFGSGEKCAYDFFCMSGHRPCAPYPLMSIPDAFSRQPGSAVFLSCLTANVMALFARKVKDFLEAPHMNSPARPKPVVLCILDGWGSGAPDEANAITKANTPNWDRLLTDCPSTDLKTCGLDVGLPEGQMGNSEVGHMNIGAGRVVMQFLPRIDEAFAKGEIKDNEALRKVISKTKESAGTVHLMGLLSDGGVHAHLNHIAGLANILKDAGVKCAVHAFTDGRDTSPTGGAAYMEAFMAQAEGVNVVTVTGRYFAMDRDNRWDRVQQAYDAIVCGKGQAEAATPLDAIQQAYDADNTDEFIPATIIGDYQGMQDGDAILFANFRSDRAREILGALINDDFDGFTREKKIKFAVAAGMVPYEQHLDAQMETLFPPLTHRNILGEVIADAGLKQLRIAETEKYPHVTFFFNAGNETPFAGEERILVPSPKVATYDLQPEMSAPEVTEKLLAAISSDQFDAVVVNFANPDMVGHSGDLAATMKAVEAVDEAVGKLHVLVMEKGGVLMVTADHGNAEQMVDPKSGGPHTAHTLNPVKFILCGAGDVSLKSGRLADIAPTMLALLKIDLPDEMTGVSLIG